MVRGGVRVTPPPFLPPSCPFCVACLPYISVGVVSILSSMLVFSSVFFRRTWQVGLSNKGRSLPGLMTAMLAPAGQDDHKVRPVVLS